MEIKEQQLRPKVIDITCDICGKSCTVNNKKFGIKTINHARLETNFNYSTRFSYHYQTDFCEDCFSKIKDIIELELSGKMLATKIIHV